MDYRLTLCLKQLLSLSIYFVIFIHIWFLLLVLSRNWAAPLVKGRKCSQDRLSIAEIEDPATEQKQRLQDADTKAGDSQNDKPRQFLAGPATLE